MERLRKNATVKCFKRTHLMTYCRDPTAKILIVGDEDRIPYMRPPLSKVGSVWFIRRKSVSCA